MISLYCSSVSVRLRGARLLAAGMSVATIGLTAPAAQAADLSFLQGLLANTPQGGWVKASTGLYSDAWATEAQGGLSPGTYSQAGGVVSAWSSMAWDSNRGNIILFGGGHATYMGNEIYLWQGSNGTWTRGSLPSRLIDQGNAVFTVVDNAAPQSAHTYDNQLYLPINDRFISFGGATFNTGGGWLTRDGQGNLVGAGPWVWDPSKANANQVGGTTGSGYLPGITGGNMWINRAPASTGNRGGSALEGTTAYRTENGRDVVYTTRDSNSSGFPDLYRFEAGNFALGQPDRWDVVGNSFAASSLQSAAAIDSTNNYYVRISNRANTNDDFGLGVWDLDQASPATPASDRFITLRLPNGTKFETNRNMGIAYDDANRRFVLWDGENRGLVYYTTPQAAADGEPLLTWTVVPAASATAAQPNGAFLNGVLGKWIYVPELDAFMALDEYNDNRLDAEVWLYKPFAIDPIPELPTGASLAAGLLLMAAYMRRRAISSTSRAGR